MNMSVRDAPVETANSRRYEHSPLKIALLGGGIGAILNLVVTLSLIEFGVDYRIGIFIGTLLNLLFIRLYYKIVFVSRKYVKDSSLFVSIFIDIVTAVC